MVDALVAALDGQRWQDALPLAVTAWQATRADAAADLVDAIAARLPAPTAPNDGNWCRRPAIHAAWLERAAGRSHLAVGELIAGLRTHGTGEPREIRARWEGRGNPVFEALARNPRPGWEDAFAERVAVLVEYPDDPRIARALVELLVRPGPHRLHARVFPVLADRIGALGDRRHLPALARCAVEPRGRTDAERACQVEAARCAQAALERVAPRPPDPRVPAWLAKLGGPPDATSERARPERPDRVIETLWAEIAANPDDLGARAVLGDALVEAGDLRGDLIVLQCQGRVPGRPLRGTSRAHYDGRVKSLIRREWQRWMGALALILLRRSCEFRHGMLEVAAIGRETTPPWAWAKARGHRELSCVHTVRHGQISPEHYADFVAALPRVPATLAIDRPELLAALGRVRPTLTTAALHLLERADPRAPTFAARSLPHLIALVARHLPRVRELGFDVPRGDTSWLAGLPTMLAPLPGLERVVITNRSRPPRVLLDDPRVALADSL